MSSRDHGYTVEDFRDAPMRPRAWFERRDDAEAWARAQLGDHAYVRPFDGPSPAAIETGRTREGIVAAADNAPYAARARERALPLPHVEHTEADALSEVG